MMVTNKDRTRHARLALAEFSKYQADDPKYYSMEDGICDLLADLMHLADNRELDFEELLNRARVHYTEEKK